MTSTPRRGRGDAGSAVVETAFALPVVFLLLMMVIDFSMMELKQSQVTSASRDGARVGIISWKGADTGTYSGGACPTTPASYATICKAVLARLAGATASSIDVTCYVGSTTTVVACSQGSVIEGIDMMKVTVGYSYRTITPPGQLVLGPTRQFSSSTRMVIQ